LPELPAIKLAARAAATDVITRAASVEITLLGDGAPLRQSPDLLQTLWQMPELR
jgi:hypothetical protein